MNQDLPKCVSVSAKDGELPLYVEVGPISTSHLWWAWLWPWRSSWIHGRSQFWWSWPFGRSWLWACWHLCVCFEFVKEGGFFFLIRFLIYVMFSRWFCWHYVVWFWWITRGLFFLDHLLDNNSKEDGFVDIVCLIWQSQGGFFFPLDHLLDINVIANDPSFLPMSSRKGELAIAVAAAVFMKTTFPQYDVSSSLSRPFKDVARSHVSHDGHCCSQIQDKNSWNLCNLQILSSWRSHLRLEQQIPKNLDQGKENLLL